MRIDNISVVDEEEMLEFIRRGQTSTPSTNLEIEGNTTESWSCFCKGKSKIDKDMIELFLVIERRGKREFRKPITSMLVPNNKFPSGDFFLAVDLSGRRGR